MARPKKNERKDSSNKPFEADKHIVQMRLDLNNLIAKNFGFDETLFEAKKATYLKSIEDSPRKDELISMYDLNWNQFYEAHIESSKQFLLEETRNVSVLYKKANSIYPCGLPCFNFIEYMRRRDLLDDAISSCQAIKTELNYVVKALPVSPKHYESYFKSITQEIKLLKGIRQSDNRFLKLDYLHNVSGFSSEAKEYAKAEFQEMCSSLFPVLGLQIIAGSLQPNQLLDCLDVVNKKDIELAEKSRVTEIAADSSNTGIKSSSIDPFADLPDYNPNIRVIEEAKPNVVSSQYANLPIM